MAVALFGFPLAYGTHPQGALWPIYSDELTWELILRAVALNFREEAPSLSCPLESCMLLQCGSLGGCRLLQGIALARFLFRASPPCSPGTSAGLRRMQCGQPAVATSAVAITAFIQGYTF